MGKLTHFSLFLKRNEKWLNHSLYQPVYRVTLLLLLVKKFHTPTSTPKKWDTKVLVLGYSPEDLVLGLQSIT